MGRPGIDRCAADGGDRTGEIVLWGNMSTMNLPIAGLDLGRPKDILKHELGQGDGNWGDSTDNFSDDE